ncbi:MAG: hypothetical protein ACLPX7_23255 [Xanthobacteraceae bacterium]
MCVQVDRTLVTADSNRGETAELPRQFYDASLLFSCMDMLQVDQRALAADDPLLFRELQGRCSLCRHKHECAEDRAHPFDDAKWQQWQQYCPNSAVLTMIGAIHNCGYAAQRLKMPQSSSEIG